MWQPIIHLQISHSNFGVLLQASLAFATFFTFIEGIVIWRLDRYKNDKANQKDILNDFIKFSPRYILFIVFILAALFVWSFFNFKEDDQISNAFRYFSLFVVSIMACGFYYLFKSAFSYIKNFRGPTESEQTKNGANYSLSLKVKDFSLSLKRSKDSEKS